MPSNYEIIPDEAIVLGEKPIILTDEKISRLLQDAYEKAVEDVLDLQGQWNWKEMAKVLFSIAITMLITLSTSTVKDFSWIKADTLTNFFTFLFFSAVTGGLFCLFMLAKQKKIYDPEVRKKSIQEIMDKII